MSAQTLHSHWRRRHLVRRLTSPPCSLHRGTAPQRTRFDIPSAVWPSCISVDWIPQWMPLKSGFRRQSDTSRHSTPIGSRKSDHYKYLCIISVRLLPLMACDVDCFYVRRWVNLALLEGQESEAESICDYMSQFDHYWVKSNWEWIGDRYVWGWAVWCEPTLSILRFSRLAPVDSCGLRSCPLSLHGSMRLHIGSPPPWRIQDRAPSLVELSCGSQSAHIRVRPSP